MEAKIRVALLVVLWIVTGCLVILEICTLIKIEKNCRFDRITINQMLCKITREFVAYLYVLLLLRSVSELNQKTIMLAKIIERQKYMCQS